MDLRIYKSFEHQCVLPAGRLDGPEASAAGSFLCNEQSDGLCLQSGGKRDCASPLMRRKPRSRRRRPATEGLTSMESHKMIRNDKVIDRIMANQVNEFSR